MPANDVVAPLAVATAQYSLMETLRSRASMLKPATNGLRRLTRWATSPSTAECRPAILGTVASEFLEIASMGQVSVRQIKPTALIVHFTGLVDLSVARNMGLQWN
jgi:hypothetical protein